MVEARRSYRKMCHASIIHGIAKNIKEIFPCLTASSIGSYVSNLCWNS